MEMYKVKLYGISNVILKDHKKHYKLQGDVGLVRRLLVEADGLDDDLGDGVRVAVAARPPVLQVAVTLLSALPTPITAQYCYSGPISAEYYRGILMLQPLLATPALKSWMLEVSCSPVRRLSLS